MCEETQRKLKTREQEEVGEIHQAQDPELPHFCQHIYPMVTPGFVSSFVDTGQIKNAVQTEQNSFK